MRMVRVLVLIVAVTSGAATTAVWPQQPLPAAINELVSQMIASMEQQQKRKLAILDFTRLDGTVDNLGRYLSERLITNMFRTRKFEVIERRQLDRILTELKLNLSDLIDPANAKRFGKIYGVDAIASGSLSVLGSAVEVNARLIETETGRVFAVAATQLRMDSDVQALLGAASKPGPTGGIRQQASPVAEGLQRFRFSHKAFAFQLASIERSGDELVLTFTYSNLTSIRQRAYTYHHRNYLDVSPRLTDDLGGTSFCSRCRGDRQDGGVFEPGADEPFVLAFKVRPEAQTARLQFTWSFQVEAYKCCEDQRITLDGIPLPR